jgi:uncharacterized protein YijF (DUF1287 family)
MDIEKMIAAILFAFLQGPCTSDIAKYAESLLMFVIYDPTYVNIDYPNGDVDPRRGVCTDVVIRTLRGVGIDLQVEVYKHRKAIGKPTDRNIDHRRVPNMCAYFEYSPNWEIVDEPQPGDVIWWITPRGSNHVGVVTSNGKVMHNYGLGQRANVYPNYFDINKIYRYKCTK